MIPSTPLTIDFDPAQMTAKEYEALFDVKGKSQLEMSIVLLKFLRVHSSSWTEAEIDDIRLPEFDIVFGSLFEAIQNTIVPKGKKMRSSNGRVAKRRVSQAG